MPTTTTTYSFNKPVVGADEDDWGGYLNGNFDNLDDLLDGTTPVTGIDINSGTLDGVTIGGTTAGAGTFTTLTANTSITGTLATAAQPNITSVGSLTSLDVGGTVTADGLTVDGSIVLNNASAQNISFTNTAVNPTISSVRALNIDIDSDGNQSTTAINFTHDNGAGTIASFNETGDISFYEDTGTTAKFFWDASLESVGIGTTSLTPTDGANIELSSATSSRIILDSTGTGGRKYTMASGTNGSLDFYDYDAAAYRMRIDSSGNVGIGTSSPSYKLDLTSSSDGYARQWISSQSFVSSADNSAGFQIRNLGAGTTGVKFSNYANNAEWMRIDSSGNLLVGKTSATGFGSTAGFEVLSDGRILSTVSGDQALALSRTSSDGNIAEFYKDSTTVGSIGSAAGSRLFIGCGDTGVRFAGDLDTIVPWNTNNTLRDAAIDLGEATGRFKDLYLSGGVYLGGTGAANKMEDYEEGTFTPTMTGGVTGSVTGNYTKIGNTVHIRMNVYRPTDITSSTDIYIGGLPFTSSNIGHSQLCNVALRYYNVDEKIVAGYNITHNSTSGNILMFADSYSDYQYLQNNAGASTYCAIVITGSYQTDA